MATVTVSRGVESYVINVKVSSCVAAVGEALVPRLVVNAGQTMSLDIANYFAKTGGGALTYEASSSNTDTFSVELSDSQLTLQGGTLPEGVDKAQAELRLTAHNGCGAAKLLILVTVTKAVVNKPPTIDSPLGAKTLASHGYMAMIALSDHFSDPEMKSLRYSVASSDLATVAGSIDNDTLTVTTGAVSATAKGSIFVTATDSVGLSVTDTLVVTVTPNQSPTVTNPIEDVEMTRGGKEFDTHLTGRFSDPEGGPLTFSVGEDDFVIGGQDTSPITAEITGDFLTVTPDLVGSATVIVRATDPGGRWVKDRFNVTVAAGKRSNPDSVNVRSAPVPVGSIPDQALTIVGSAVRFDVASFFMEPDGDTVMYSARLASEAERIPDYVSVDMSGSMLTLTPGTISGSIDVLVSASDVNGAASQTFTVNVAGAN